VRPCRLCSATPGPGESDIGSALVDEVDRFHVAYYDSEVWKDDTRWFGVPAQKCPLDLWVYQELLFQLRPDLVIETGTASGGSAYFLASIMDLLGRGRVVTIDIQTIEGRPQHDRIRYVTGSSLDEEIVGASRAKASGAETVMVILDSAHEKEHVLAELHAYSPLVTPGSYLVVEDTNVNGHPVLPVYGPGPAEAVGEFLAETEQFRVDRSREKFLLTFNPRGYLQRLPVSA
jgi:cephalosporin hydroxylase